MNIHLLAILMFTRGTRFWPIPKWFLLASQFSISWASPFSIVLRAIPGVKIPVIEGIDFLGAFGSSIPATGAIPMEMGGLPPRLEITILGVVNHGKPHDNPSTPKFIRNGTNMYKLTVRRVAGFFGFTTWGRSWGYKWIWLNHAFNIV